MTVLTRRQFKQHWEGIAPGTSKDNSILWCLERHYNKKSRWFVKTRPVFCNPSWSDLGRHPKDEFWVWCNRNCAGQILCYSSNEQEEWWGFSHRADIVIWMLKWSK